MTGPGDREPLRFTPPAGARPTPGCNCPLCRHARQLAQGGNRIKTPEDGQKVHTPEQGARIQTRED